MSNLISLGDGYVEWALYLVEDDLGRCRPVYDIYFGVVNMLCYRLLDPFNWLWAGMGLVLLIMLPMAWIGICLAAMYRRLPKSGSRYPGLEGAVPLSAYGRASAKREMAEEMKGEELAAMRGWDTREEDRGERLLDRLIYE